MFNQSWDFNNEFLLSLLVSKKKYANSSLNCFRWNIAVSANTKIIQLNKKNLSWQCIIVSDERYQLGNEDETSSCIDCRILEKNIYLHISFIRIWSVIFIYHTYANWIRFIKPFVNVCFPGDKTCHHARVVNDLFFLFQNIINKFDNFATVWNIFLLIKVNSLKSFDIVWTFRRHEHVYSFPNL